MPCEQNLTQLIHEITQCRACPRLVAWREKVGEDKRRAFLDQTYWAKPVPGFGDPNAKILVVGLAPGAHGSNRTGRMFTGDASGEFLFAALHRAGFANQPQSQRIDDGLALNQMFITAVCRCVPPDNKPLPAEITNCLRFLRCERDLLPSIEGVVALGKIAFDVVKKEILDTKSEESLIPFAHGVFIDHTEKCPWILGSYHPSRQNTQTGRLTVEMFDSIWLRARGMITN